MRPHADRLRARFRKGIETELNSRFRFLYKDSPEQKVVFDFFTKWMADKLPGRPDLAEMLIPDFSVGCRRLTPGGGFLEAREWLHFWVLLLTLSSDQSCVVMTDNVTLTNSGVVSCSETGITTADGEHREFDVIICATGKSCHLVRLPSKANMVTAQASTCRSSPDSSSSAATASTSATSGPRDPPPVRSCALRSLVIELTSYTLIKT